MCIRDSTYVADNDKELKSFNIDHDRKYKIPFIKEAMKAAGGKLDLFASPWSPPAWMKDNNNMLQGGKLKPEFYNSWAMYYTKFIKEYEKEGVPVWGISEMCIRDSRNPSINRTLANSLFNGCEWRWLCRYLGWELGAQLKIICR